MIKGKVVVKGSKVQDVGYRLFLLNLASEACLSGFQARNVDTDCVEAVYEGGEHEVRGFVEAVKRFKPEEAEVSSIDFEKYEGPVKPIETFRSEFNTIQLGKIIEIGIKMIEKQDLTVKKIDVLGEKIDGLGEKIDTVGEKVDGLGVKMDSLTEKVDNLAEKVDGLGEKIDGLGV
ncbi:MAG: acylphosphatase, partial [Crenarchaeota archaeon]|nr:acylphosphatase [Thermoproteota archaeon]